MDYFSLVRFSIIVPDYKDLVLKNLEDLKNKLTSIIQSLIIFEEIEETSDKNGLPLSYTYWNTTFYSYLSFLSKIQKDISFYIKAGEVSFFLDRYSVGEYTVFSEKKVSYLPDISDPRDKDIVLEKPKELNILQQIYRKYYNEFESFESHLYTTALLYIAIKNKYLKFESPGNILSNIFSAISLTNGEPSPETITVNYGGNLKDEIPLKDKSLKELDDIYIVKLHNEGIVNSDMKTFWANIIRMYMIHAFWLEKHEKEVNSTSGYVPQLINDFNSAIFLIKSELSVKLATSSLH
jgi:hypothetical protein